MNLLELLTRTRFQVFTFPKGDMKNGEYPDGAGSGFILRHKDKSIFVTADHVCHPFDHEPERTKRIFEDKDVAIVNNWIEKDAIGNDIPIFTPIGGFYYFDKFKISNDLILENYRPYDATFAILNPNRFQKPFKSEPLCVLNGPNMPGGLDMIQIPSENAILPTNRDRYIVYGHTKFGIGSDNIHLTWNISLHEGMKYKGENGDYYVLTPSEPIVNKDWEGISGAPVFNQEGGLLGILCGGVPQNNEIFVMKMQSIISLIETTLKIERIEADSR